MGRFRFSIASLLLVVFFVGLAVAALRAATDAWDSGLFGLTLLTLLLAVLLAVHRAERRRAYWLGFALFGWAYLVAGVVPAVEPRLPTTKLLTYLDSKVPGRAKTFTFSVALNNQPTSNTVQSFAFTPQGNTFATSSQGSGSIRFWNATTGALLTGTGGTTEAFVHIGHSIMALALAALGGQLSRYLVGADREPPTPAGP